MPTSYQKIVDDLQAQSFHKTAITCSQEEIEAAVKAFFAFMQLPEETKVRFSARLDPEDRGTEIGYWTRRRSEGHADDRGYFHYSEAADKLFRPKGQDCPELIAFMDAAKVVHTSAAHTMHEVVHVIDEQHPGLEQALFNPGNGRELRLPLRFLAYTQSEPGNFLAIGHYDRGACTLAVAESAPGLRIGKTPETVKEVAHEPGYGLFFPGIHLQEFTNETFAPSWHDVVQKDQDAFQTAYARWAVVLFASVWDRQILSWDACHTPQK